MQQYGMHPQYQQQMMRGGMRPGDPNMMFMHQSQGMYPPQYVRRRPAPNARPRDRPSAVPAAAAAHAPLSLCAQGQMMGPRGQMVYAQPMGGMYAPAGGPIICPCAHRARGA